MEELEPKMEGESPEPAPVAAAEPETAAAEPVSPEELLGAAPEPAPDLSASDAELRAVLEALVYITEEPLTVAQIAAALARPVEQIQVLMAQLMAEFDAPGHGVHIKEVAGGYKMATKPEHHEAVRSFVKSLKPPLKLSLPALETLAVIAYKQPVTGPEIMEIRGVQGGGVLKTLLDRKLIAVAGRKNVIGKPMLYKTTKEFLLQFGLRDLAELPSLKEFEEIRRMAFSDDAPPAPESPEPAAGPELSDAASEAAPAPDVAPPDDALPDTAPDREEVTPSAPDSDAGPGNAAPDDGPASDPDPAEPSTPDAAPDAGDAASDDGSPPGPGADLNPPARQDT
jgi:segregation and condensation protein B